MYYALLIPNWHPCANMFCNTFLIT